MQLRELRAHAASQNLTVFEEYLDHGVSGAKASRPALDRMMADARSTPKKFDAVLVWKLDRFSRSLKHLINSLDLLSTSGVAFISLRDNLDLSTASGRLMFQMIGAFAEFERALTRERVTAGLVNARAKGKVLGRKKRAGVDVAAILKLRSEGKSWRQIQKETGIPQATLRGRCAEYLPQTGACG